MAEDKQFLAERRCGNWEGPLEDIRMFPEGTKLYAVLPKQEETRQQLSLGLTGEPKEGEK